MNRTEKTEFIDRLKERFQKADATLAVSFTRLSVDEATALRAQFREQGVEYRVVKNTLAKLAAAGTDAESLQEHFVGPTAVVLGYDDVVAPAKVLYDFLGKKENEGKLEVKGGVVQGRAVKVKEIEALAKLPGLPELRAQLLALFNTPATTLARLIKTPGQQIAQVIKAHAEEAS